MLRPSVSGLGQGRTSCQRTPVEYIGYSQEPEEGDSGRDWGEPQPPKHTPSHLLNLPRTCLHLTNSQWHHQIRIPPGDQSISKSPPSGNQAPRPHPVGDTSHSDSDNGNAAELSHHASLRG